MLALKYYTRIPTAFEKILIARIGWQRERGPERVYGGRVSRWLGAWNYIIIGKNAYSKCLTHSRERCRLLKIKKTSLKD